MSKPTPTAYKTRNWPDYNAALQRRGSLSIWFDSAMIWEAEPTGKRGRQPDYSDAPIPTCLTMQVLFGMALRQTTGFVESLLQLIDLDWAVPNFSTPQPTPEGPEGQHPLSRFSRPAAPVDRQHQD